MKKNLKKFRGNYKCKYCGNYFTSNSKEEIKRHEEELHGCFRDINPRKPKATRDRIGFKEPDEKEFIRKSVTGLDMIYRWDEKEWRYRIYIDCLKYKPGEEVEVIENKDGIYEVIGLEEMRREWNNAHNIVKIPDVDVICSFIDDEVY
jgi:hypothetical protein